MLEGKNISVISSNYLVCLGLKAVLTDLFSPGTVTLFQNFDEYANLEKEFQYDLIFLHSDLYVLHNKHFQLIKNKLVIITENEHNNFSNQSELATLRVTQSQNDIIEQLEDFFTSRINKNSSEAQEELSQRELEVLKLVAVGLLNKQIADQLSISLHTVISHRKNITRKLAIKTVSGLTVYAMLNGLISSEHLK
jgi:DNA-binding CsgD family transcriptional regulator